MLVLSSLGVTSLVQKESHRLNVLVVGQPLDKIILMMTLRSHDIACSDSIHQLKGGPSKLPSNRDEVRTTSNTSNTTNAINTRL